MKRSGYGRELGPVGMEEFVNKCLMTVKKYPFIAPQYGGCSKKERPPFSGLLSHHTSHNMCKTVPLPVHFCT
ncbi:hypothetical protein A6F49_08920 [Enteractinococcus helveticum]|uniref:Uncharacterized protein n=1 Tax=Enteractinococcus helveticum TaxID=1837282 RepID=A0A1B7M0E1_9MICC|nr:hypothetical protein A6F49_08920 [Enteractinococcus helveticum]